MADTILIIDDDNAILESTRAVLESEGYRVVSTTNPFFIPSMVREESPKLILADVEMPALSGEQLAKFMGPKSCPNVFHSGKDRHLLAQLALMPGFAGYVQKSAGPEALIAKVKNFLAA